MKDHTDCINIVWFRWCIGAASFSNQCNFSHNAPIKVPAVIIHCIDINIYYFLIKYLGVFTAQTQNDSWPKNSISKQMKQTKNGRRNRFNWNTCLRLWLRPCCQSSILFIRFRKDIIWEAAQRNWTAVFIMSLNFKSCLLSNSVRCYLTEIQSGQVCCQRYQ